MQHSNKWGFTSFLHNHQLEAKSYILYSYVSGINDTETIVKVVTMENEKNTKRKAKEQTWRLLQATIFTRKKRGRAMKRNSIKCLGHYYSWLYRSYEKEMKAHMRYKRQAAGLKYWLPLNTMKKAGVKIPKTHFTHKSFDLYYEDFSYLKSTHLLILAYIFKNKCKMTSRTCQFLLQQHKTLIKNLLIYGKKCLNVKNILSN